MPIEVEDLLNQVDVTIRGAVRHKLRVSLRANDYREQNLDGLDVLQEIRLKLVKKLTTEEGETSIQELTAYAATVAYRTCSDYLRAKYPVRTSLKNTLRRILDKAEEFEIWESRTGEPVCGYPGWKNAAFNTDTARVQELRADPYKLPTEAIPRCAADHMRWAEWRVLLEGVFAYVDGPVPLDDLIAIVAPVVGMEDVPDTGESEGDDDEGGFDASTLRSSDPTPEAHWMARERLKLYWAAVLKLLVWHRIAYLLNHREGDLEALPLYGVATLHDIAESLDMTDRQLAALASELGVAPPTATGSRGSRFLLFWKYLPLEDNIVAAVLEVTRAQVIAYRNKARERLKRMLRAEL
ncbi:MAG TPA: hypothetical protein VF392_16565 [Terracidiphilus sp.]